MVIRIFQFQLARIKSNLITFLLIILSAIGALFVGFKHDTLKQAIAYVFVMWLCAFIVDLITISRPPKNDFVVKNPKKETLYFFICFILGVLFFFIRFSGIVDWPNLNPFIKLAAVPLVLCIYPVALAIILLFLKYKPKDLGLRFRGLLVAVPVILICAITNRLICPDRLTWDAVMAEGGGILGVIYSGFILAGLSEEFFRAIGQTRLGAFINNKGLGWFIITVLWAFMHFPKWYGDDHNVTEAFYGAIRIIPLGLMWGYITHRTKSFIPAVIVHGVNFWGLQNF